MVTDTFSGTYTSFDGHKRIASGSLHEVALRVKQVADSGAEGPIMSFDDTTGRPIDIDTRGSLEDVAARFAPPAPGTDPAQRTDDSGTPSEGTRERGRPKLGVTAREVTLLPRHWEWLATQPGGASVTLRKLVEEARRTHSDKDKIRTAQERAYRFMSMMAGDMPDFEEATRALFANDQTRLTEFVAAWPSDVREHTIRLAFGDSESAMPAKS